MIIFSPKKVEDALRDGTFTSWEKAKYIILTAVVTAIGEPFYLVAPTIKQTNTTGTEILVRLVATITGLVITYFGVKHCYRINDDSERFIERFICLRVPWTAIFALTFGPINLAVLYTAEKQLETSVFRGISAFIGSLTIALFYWALSGSFKRLSASDRHIKAPN
jgi:hypothetical protein